jgi:hypothetical protein
MSTRICPTNFFLLSIKIITDSLKIQWGKLSGREQVPVARIHVEWHVYPQTVDFCVLEPQIGRLGVRITNESMWSDLHPESAKILTVKTEHDKSPLV